MNTELRRRGPLAAALVLALLVWATVSVLPAAAQASQAPQSSAPPSIGGHPTQGQTLTASTGAWSNSPSGYAYQWQQCDQTGATCTSIGGATSQSYTVASTDVDHTLRVAVTATNAAGSATATSAATGDVSSNTPPVNTAGPTVSGTAKVGEQLSASQGTWTGGVRSYAYQWQVCDAGGDSCSAVTGATAPAYGVRSADMGQTLRVVVTATNHAGSASATSAATAVVAPLASPVPAPTTAPRSVPPQIEFVALRRVGIRIYARFSLCGASARPVTVVEHDLMPGRLGYARSFSVSPAPCGTHLRSWLLIDRLRHHGRFVVTLRAVTSSGRSTRIVSRTLDLQGSI